MSTGAAPSTLTRTCAVEQPLVLHVIVVGPGMFAGATTVVGAAPIEPVGLFAPKPTLARTSPAIRRPAAAIRVVGRMACPLASEREKGNVRASATPAGRASRPPTTVAT